MLSQENASSTAVDKMAEPFRDKILRKCGESVEMKQKFFETYAEQIEKLSREMADRFSSGKKLFSMGNGGSLCDALHFAVEFTHPIIEKRAAYPAIPLMTDIATMTAISNDTDYARVFVDQLRLLGQPGDMESGIVELVVHHRRLRGRAVGAGEGLGRGAPLGERLRPRRLEVDRVDDGDRRE